MMLHTTRRRIYQWSNLRMRCSQNHSKIACKNRSFCSNYITKSKCNLFNMLWVTKRKLLLLSMKLPQQPNPCSTEKIWEKTATTASETYTVATSRSMSALSVVCVSAESLGNGCLSSIPTHSTYSDTLQLCMVTWDVWARLSGSSSTYCSCQSPA